MWWQYYCITDVALEYFTDKWSCFQQNECVKEAR